MSFRINGYAGQAFRGKVTRVDPSAKQVTLQVEVLVSFADAMQPRVSGLYAQGTIESASIKALTLPESVLLRTGNKSSVWRTQASTLNQVELTLGACDPRTGDYEMRNVISSVRYKLPTEMRGVPGVAAVNIHGPTAPGSRSGRCGTFPTRPQEVAEDRTQPRPGQTDWHFGQ